MMRLRQWLDTDPEAIWSVPSKNDMCCECQMRLKVLIGDVNEHEVGALFANPEYRVKAKVDAKSTFEAIG